MSRHQKTGAGWEKWLAGAALGAVAMYYSDPRQGRRRRALLRDQIYSIGLGAADVRDATAHDFGNRLQGVRARLLQTFGGQQPAEEEVLVSRVRAQLGHLVSHPHAIEVTADGGHVVLSGAILVDERDRLLAQARRIPGVADVEDRLTVYASAAGVPALQGRHRTATGLSGRPALQALAGGALGAYGLTRRGGTGMVLASAGMALLGRAIEGLRQMNRQHRAEAAAIHLEQSIEVHASSETVFDAWSDFENFPHFFSKLLAVHDLGNGRARWVAQETSNSRLEWNAAWNMRERPRRLGWHSEPAAAFGHAGEVTLEPTRQGTRVTLRLTLKPPPGAPADALHRMAGTDPARELDEDLIRMKSFIESGVVPHHGTRSPQPAGGQLLH
ncbi:SRPBCC family protein [Janthinobacterium sp. 17J80-10]|uniref:SRPBCC family protein n=1 Tax=Janthinobacterium sp. 17J80-10 TaxID=2497863 RepID=UPI00100572C1|nr:SRPBCC family protein [Janthinobacterium sp. 17J80-10]QAU34752.1 BON domain-containing protein [Janthinobacterium sp. 17J80-10]